MKIILKKISSVSRTVQKNHEESASMPVKDFLSVKNQTKLLSVF